MQRPKTINDEVIDLKRQINKELATPASSSRSSVSSFIESSPRSRGGSSASPSLIEGGGRGSSGSLLKKAGGLLAARVSRSSSKSESRSESESDFDRNSRLMGECDKVLSRVINAKDISERDRVMCLNDLKELYEKLTQISAQTNKLDKMSSAKASKLEQISESDSKSDAEKLESQSRAAVKTIASVISKSESAMRAESKKPAPVERSESSEELVMPDSGGADLIIAAKIEDVKFKHTTLMAIESELKTRPDAETVRSYAQDLKQLLVSGEAEKGQIQDVARKVTEYYINNFKFKKDDDIRDTLNDVRREIKANNSMSLMVKAMGGSAESLRESINNSNIQEKEPAVKEPVVEQARARSKAPQKPVPQPPEVRNDDARNKEEQEQAVKTKPLPRPGGMKG